MCRRRCVVSVYKQIEVQGPGLTKVGSEWTLLGSLFYYGAFAFSFTICLYSHSVNQKMGMTGEHGHRVGNSR